MKNLKKHMFPKIVMTAIFFGTAGYWVYVSDINAAMNISLLVVVIFTWYTAVVTWVNLWPWWNPLKWEKNLQTMKTAPNFFSMTAYLCIFAISILGWITLAHARRKARA